MRLAVFVLATVLGATVTAQQVYDPGNRVTLPVVVKEVRPQYTAAAMAAKIEGKVLLKAVVLDDGRVSDDVEVIESLDPELDQQAVTALKAWEFKPGMRAGEPVAVRIFCELTFTLK